MSKNALFIYEWGSKGREFESRRPDHFYQVQVTCFFPSQSTGMMKIMQIPVLPPGSESDSYRAESSK